LLAELQVKNQDLEKANIGLRQANELKEAFISVASHELRTPLTILLGLTELSLLTPGLMQPLQEWLTQIHKAGLRLNHLTNQLMQMLLSGNFERSLQRRPTDLAALLQQAVVDVRPFLEQRRHELTLDLPANLGSLAVESTKIRDSVAHLLLNAIKFTPDGGKIRLAARRTESGGAEIEVSDSGVGIDPASLPHIFDPFFTAFDVSRHSSGQLEFGRRGLGLGLSLVKIFVEMHGGKVTVSSEPSVGTTFVISLRAPPVGEGES